MMTRPICALVLLAAGAAFANPNGPTVASGSASFSTSGNTLTVTNSNGAIINWQGFSIGSGETTRFQQPSSSSTVLNRVTGSGGSEIHGALTSNGKVFLVNPNGVLFGPGAQVSVAGLVATSLDITDADFLAANYRFVNGGSAGPVTSRGTIVADNGPVVLFAPQVTLAGTITATGPILILAGSRVTLTPSLGFGSVEGEGTVFIDDLNVNSPEVIIHGGGLPSIPPGGPSIILPTIPELGGGTIVSSGSSSFTSGGVVTVGQAGTIPNSPPSFSNAVVMLTSTTGAAPNVVAPAAGVSLNLQKREVSF
jgi:filamentous hemagglutinin family protein